MPTPDKLTKRSRNVGSNPRKTAKEKLADKAQETSTASDSVAASQSSSTSVAIAPTPTSTIKTVSDTGLGSFALSDIKATMPSDWNREAYKVTDSLNPPSTIPQASEAQYEQSKTIYEGGIRAIKLSGMAYDLSKEGFITEGKKADSYGAGIRTATKFEKVKGDVIDHNIQLQANEQKNATLGVATHSAVQGKAKAIYDNALADEKLNQARIASEEAQAQTKSKQAKLDEIVKQLGTKTPQPQPQ